MEINTINNIQSTNLATKNALSIKEKLIQITENANQVIIILLVAKGYSFEEIVGLTNSPNSTNVRANYLAGKQKIVVYFHQNPKEGQAMKRLLS